MEIKRENTQARHPLTRLQDWNEYAAPFSDEALKRQGSRCMDCSIPFCHIGMEIDHSTSGCPIHNLIPEWNDLVYKGRWKEALDRLMKTNNFPEFTGRVCPAPCEGSCTVSINDEAVAIKNIERSIIDKGFENGWIKPRIPKQRTGKTVAIIGSGPSGLAAADQLNQAGHSVTVYERSDRAGGLLMYGIPNMKLDKHVVERRIRLLEEEGINFILNTEVGHDITAEQLQTDYDSVILCIGSQRPRDLPIQGRECTGIHFAMDYLTNATKHLLNKTEAPQDTLNAKGKDVVIIGGGDTGADCVATAIRQGARSVNQFAINSPLPIKRAEGNEWPAYPKVYSLEYAHKEAKAKFGKDVRQYCIQTKAFITDGDDGVQALYTVDVDATEDKNGLYSYEEIPRSGEVWPAQLVIIAIGFVGPQQSLLEQFGIHVKKNKIDAEYGEFETNVEGVFAAGDARRGQSLIVWAINEGREVASKVDHYLMGKSLLPTLLTH